MLRWVYRGVALVAVALAFVPELPVALRVVLVAAAVVLAVADLAAELWPPREITPAPGPVVVDRPILLQVTTNPPTPASATVTELEPEPTATPKHAAPPEPAEAEYDYGVEVTNIPPQGLDARGLGSFSPPRFG